MIGVLIAGGSFISIDATYPLSRLQKMIDTVRVRVILCSRGNVMIARSLVDSVLILDNDTSKNLPSSSDGENFSSPATPENAAYIIFTSGSTGEPKVSNICSSTPRCMGC